MLVKDIQQLSEVAGEFVETIKPILGKSPVVIALQGPLGAGKTTLTREFLRKLGVKDNITSPTYVLHIPYSITVPQQMIIDHLDLYRLEQEEEFLRIGIEQMIKKNHVVILEWADKFEDQIRKCTLKGVNVFWIRLEYAAEESQRTIEITKY